MVQDGAPEYGWTPIVEDPVSCEDKPPLVSEPPQKVVCVMGPPEVPAKLPPSLHPEVRAVTGPAPTPTFVAATVIPGVLPLEGWRRDVSRSYLQCVRTLQARQSLSLSLIRRLIGGKS